MILGPQLLDEHESALTAPLDPVIQYLDTRDDGTVLYVGFGSMYYPPTAAQTRLLLAAIARAGLALLMAQSPAMDEASAKAVQDHLAYHDGLLVPWVDQPRVLTHKVRTPAEFDSTRTPLQKGFAWLLVARRIQQHHGGNDRPNAHECVTER